MEAAMVILVLSFFVGLGVYYGDIGSLFFFGLGVGCSWVVVEHNLYF